MRSPNILGGSLFFCLGRHHLGGLEKPDTRDLKVLKERVPLQTIVSAILVHTSGYIQSLLRDCHIQRLGMFVAAFIPGREN